jgi:hypothetical protein
MAFIPSLRRIKNKHYNENNDKEPLAFNDLLLEGVIFIQNYS